MGYITRTFWLSVLSTSLLTGCAGAPAFNRAMVQYDQSAVEAEKEILLLNIARIDDEQPPHFTSVSDIKAAFTFESNAMFNPSFLTNGTTYNLTLGARVNENPTITLAPIQGEDFTKRFLKPIEFSAFNTLFMQGSGPLEMLLRLMADSFQQERDLKCVPKEHDATLFQNRPTKKKYNPAEPTSYDEFRQRVSHLEALRRATELSFGTLDRDEYLTETARADLPTIVKDFLDRLDKNYRWKKHKVEGKKKWVLSKRIEGGNPVIINFPNEELSDQEKQCMADEIKDHPHKQSLVLVYIKKTNKPAGSFSFRGHFRLRNLNEILRFVALGVSENEEYAVPLRQETKDVLEAHKREYNSPDRTLTIRREPEVTEDVSQVVVYNGKKYWVPAIRYPNLQPQRWNQRAFALLYLILQMNLAEPKVTPPVVAVGGK